MAGWAHVRRRNRRPGLGRRAVVAGVLPVLVVTALTGCGQSKDETAGSSAPQGVTAATTDPGVRPTTPEPSPQPAPTTSGVTSGGGTDSGAGGTTGSGEPGGGGAAAGAGGGDPVPSGGSEASAKPNVSASPVFVGEPCAPGQDTAPAIAINGLTLYCAPPTPGSNGLGSWSDVPSQQQQQGPAPGAECDSSDMGHVQQDPSGRPVACLREPNGEFRWADIS
ncbi:hypothetical protein [Pseudofrankia sp. BMG5.37]|uniref:hypothetical protein n=1 Tax=Pseudofrankia sp. BMG5.37 TaxID=3050035 RepID=UPI002896036C|nr:hypothetical protein [Pseudofrankia sp. BMG5.37]MDT3446306.1 hypothetical protein [Pseudofrankia sp. BMG5.37]